MDHPAGTEGGRGIPGREEVGHWLHLTSLFPPSTEPPLFPPQSADRVKLSQGSIQEQTKVCATPNRLCSLHVK